jgi:single-strand DNA-binding protein
MENRIMYQNRATLIGFLGKDAEVKTTRNNATFTVLSLATKRSWKDRESGQYMSDTTWHRCIVWGKLGEFAATLTKGAHIQIEGDIRTREYTPKASSKKSDLVKKSITEIRVTSITKLDRPAKGDQASRDAAEEAVA